MKTAVILTIILLLAAIESTWANSWQIRNVSPDLVLLAAISGGMNLGVPGGAAVGVLAGFIQGTHRGIHMGSHIVSRCFAGVFGGYLPAALSRENTVASVMCVMGVTAAAEVVFFLMAPRFPLADWVVSTTMLCIYNGTITPLIHLPLTKVFRAQRHPGNGQLA